MFLWYGDFRSIQAVLDHIAKVGEGHARIGSQMVFSRCIDEVEVISGLLLGDIGGYLTSNTIVSGTFATAEILTCGNFPSREVSLGWRALVFAAGAIFSSREYPLLF